MIRPLSMSLILAVSAASGLPAQTPAERELQAPLVMDDGKPTQAQAKSSEPSPARAFFSLVLVLGAVGGGLWALKKYGPKRLQVGGGKRLKVQETLPLGDRRFVSILKADDEEFLLALSPQGIQLLARLDGVSTAAPADFQAALERQVDLTGPVPVREVERMIQEGRP